MSATDQQQFPGFRRNEDSLSKQQQLDHTLASHPSDSQSVGETIPPTHQPSVGQTHSNFLTVYADLTTEPQANKGFDTTESAMKVEPLQDTTQAPQMDSPLADKTLSMNQTSVYYEISLSSDSSVNETSNHLPENETSTSNLPIIDKPPPSSNPTMGTAPLSSHPPLHEPPPSHHSPEDGTLPSNQPPAGGTSPSSHPPIVDGTSTSNHPSVDKTLPSQHPPMTYIPPRSSHSRADGYQQPTNSEPADGKPCDKHTQHKTPSINKEVRIMKQTALMGPDRLLCA